MTRREQEEFLKALYKYSQGQALAGRFISHLLIGVKTSIVGHEPFAGESPCVPPLGTKED